jgi:hypothetical protein
MNMAESNGNGNGSTEKPAGLLAKLHEEWVKGGSKTADAKTAKNLVETWKVKSAARDKAEAAFRETQKEESEAVAAIIRARGKGRINIAGIGIFVPMSRGNTVYLRQEGAQDLPKFG